jgi:hypothetical protein
LQGREALVAVGPAWVEKEGRGGGEGQSPLEVTQELWREGKAWVGAGHVY